jgi:hypothetical protein
MKGEGGKTVVFKHVGRVNVSLLAGVAGRSHRVRLQAHPAQTHEKGKSWEDSPTPTGRPQATTTKVTDCGRSLSLEGPVGVGESSQDCWVHCFERETDHSQARQLFLSLYPRCHAQQRAKAQSESIICGKAKDQPQER